MRRELIRSGKTGGLSRLDALRDMLDYAPITTPVMRKAAEFRATARNLGRPSASDVSLDADMILAAQAETFSRKGDRTIIGTTNVRQLTLFSPALVWRDVG